MDAVKIEWDNIYKDCSTESAYIKYSINRKESQNIFFFTNNSNMSTKSILIGSILLLIFSSSSLFMYNWKDSQGLGLALFLRKGQYFA